MLKVILEWLPLIQSIAAVLAIFVGPIIGYLLGRKKYAAEIKVLNATVEEKEAVENKANAEAARIISEAAAVVVKPLLERISALQQDIQHLTTENICLKNSLAELKSELALLRTEKDLISNTEEL